ncbi:MAG: acyltransferase [Parvularculaceae bacterium]
MTELSAPERLHNIQALRGVAALGVLFAHLAVIERRFGGGALLPGWVDLGLAGVDLFFVVSGFVMVYVTRNVKAGGRSALTFLYKRATRIYPLYWLVSLAVLAVFLIRPEYVNSSQGNKVDIIASFLLAPQDKLPLLQVGWTLVHEMYFYITFSIFVLAPRRILPAFLGVWGVLTVAGFGVGLDKVNPWTDVAFNPLTLEFLMGAGVALLINSGWSRGAIAALTASAAALGGAFILRIGSYPDLLASDLMRTIVFGPAFALMVYGFVALERRGRFFPPRLLRVLGDASYSLYLTHLLTISALGRIWAAAAGPGVWDNVILLPLIAVAAIAAAVATYALVERPLLSWSRRAAPFRNARSDAPSEAA